MLVDGAGRDDAARLRARHRRAVTLPRHRRAVGSAPTASQRRVRFSTTRAGSSSVRMPRFSDANSPSLTPPRRVENATRYGPGAAQSKRSTPVTAQLRTRTPEQRSASVLGWVVDDFAQEVTEDVAELRPWLEPELDQIVAVDGEIGQPVRGLRSRLATPAALELLDVDDGARRPARLPR